MHAKFVRRVALWIIASLAGGTFVAVAGPLDPPSGPISSTYKTLTEVEPRIAVNSTNTPGSRDCKFRISQPGSYYLTSDVGAAFLGGGIEIAADGVTLDLMGYTVRGAADSTHGIYTDVSRRGITIRNGVVTGWDQDGIFIKGLQARVEGVTATLNLGDGINLESTAVVRGCVAANNGGNGIVTFDHVLVESCLARDNGSYGVQVTGSSIIADCSLHNNTAGGLLTTTACVVTNSVAQSNDAAGFDLGDACSISGCTAQGNVTHGIDVGSKSIARDNTCASNGGGSVGAGIRVLGSGNLIEGNNVCTNRFGIQLSSAGNVVTRNVARANTVNWDTVAGNAILVVDTAAAGAFSGDAGGTGPGSLDSNANFTY